MAGAILLQDDLNNVLLTLTDREAGILRMRFGLDDGVEKTLEEVGRAFNVSAALAWPVKDRIPRSWGPKSWVCWGPNSWVC